MNEYTFRFWTWNQGPVGSVAGGLVRSPGSVSIGAYSAQILNEHTFIPDAGHCLKRTRMEGERRRSLAPMASLHWGRRGNEPPCGVDDDEATTTRSGCRCKEGQPGYGFAVSSFGSKMNERSYICYQAGRSGRRLGRARNERVGAKAMRVRLTRGGHRAWGRPGAGSVELSGGGP